MGKKKDKALARAAGASTAQVPWRQIDADPVAFLIAPQDSQSFFAEHWEQRPCLSRATPERVALVQGLCSLPAVLNWLRMREAKQGPLEFGVDVNAARYRDGVRETPNGEVADAASLQELHSGGCTLQLHQPQRFFDPCWRLLAALERQLGCLVGANAYITPAGSQGLAPHHDDVELWVVQTSGSKAWRLYAPSNGYELPNQPSGDLDQASLGAPVLEVELQVGDVLYLPRGTVHQAKAGSGKDSSHLTISTFQRCSFADLATHLLQTGLSVQEEPQCLPLAARRSAAPGTLLKHSLHHVLSPAAAGNPTPNAVSGLAEALRAIASKLEATPEMLTAAVHSGAMDFLMNRLPPHPKQLPGRGRAPELGDRVWSRLSGWCYLLPFEMTGMVCEDDEDEGLEEGSVKLVSCLMNSREEHMITAPDEDRTEEEEEEEEDGSDDDDDDDDSGSDEGSGDEASEEAAGGSDAAAEDSVEAGNGAAAAAAEGGGQDEADADAAAAGESDGEAGAHAAAPKGKPGKAAKGGAGSKKAAPAGDGEVGSHDGGCCDEAGCSHGHGVHEHSLSSGAAERENPVAALPGLVLAPGMVKAVVAFMAAESPDQAIAIRDLPLPSDAQKLQLAFALWADGFAATVSAEQQQQKQQQQQHHKQKKHKQAAGKQKRPAAAGSDEAAAGQEATGESSGKRPSKKAKA